MHALYLALCDGGGGGHFHLGMHVVALILYLALCGGGSSMW